MIRLIQRYDEDENLYFELLIPYWDMCKCSTGAKKPSELADHLNQSGTFECLGFELVCAACGVNNDFNAVIFRLAVREGHRSNISTIWHECCRIFNHNRNL